MSKRNNRNGPNVQQQNNSVQNTPQKPKAELRDFGLLKVRTMKTKQSEAVIYKDRDVTTNFSKMSNERLIKIVQGTDLAQIRELSKYFAQTNGIYARAVRHLADIYRFDFMIYPNLDLDADLTEEENKKILKKFNIVLEHFDNSSIQLMSRKWATQVCLEGAYYGYVCDDVTDKLVIQDLPLNFCRSRFLHRGLPLIEFNVQYFDKATTDTVYREQLLNLFPEEFKAGYIKFKANKLPSENQGDDAGWIMLDIDRAFKFNFNDGDLPPFLYAIPSIIELSEVQDLEKEKLLQQLQKILVQTFQLDKNGQIPFTMTELQRLNQNAIDMVGDAVGVSVLSTVAEVHLEDLSPEGGKESENNVSAAATGVYNDLGISMNLFNTDGNLALEKSVIVDQSYVKPLLLQFEQFLNKYVSWKFNKKELKFRLKMLETATFNHVEMSDKYKDLTKIGFSRFLPMAALGHTQKEIASMAKLEQQIMQLDNWMLPPFSSNTMSSDTWKDIKTIQQSGGLQSNIVSTLPDGAGEVSPAPTPSESGATGGRPETPDAKKSDKTIANQASK